MNENFFYWIKMPTSITLKNIVVTYYWHKSHRFVSVNMIVNETYTMRLAEFKAWPWCSLSRRRTYAPWYQTYWFQVQYKENFLTCPQVSRYQVNIAVLNFILNNYYPWAWNVRRKIIIDFNTSIIRIQYLQKKIWKNISNVGKNLSISSKY